MARGGDTRGGEGLPTPPVVGGDLPTERDAAVDDTLVRGEGSARSARLPHDFVEVPRSSYRLGGEFARGGLGRIIEAVDLRLKRTVAIKELLSHSPEAEVRFVREALITSRLQHPNIVPVHEAGRWPEGERFYAMKLVDGRTLADELAAADSDSERLKLLPAVIDVCGAIAYAHSQGILHRDLKPANVLVGAFGETVLIDWGLAKDLHARDDDSSSGGGGARRSDETVEGIVVGTPPYMAPEQAAARPTDERSDVYALGAMLYHVLSGRRPYDDVHPTEVLKAVVAGPPALLSEMSRDMPPDLLAIVNKAMARDPDDRYPTAKEMAEELVRFQTGQLVAAHDYSALEIIRRFFVRHTATISIALLAFFALVVGGAWSFREINEERRQAEKNAEEALTRLDEFRLERARSLLERDPTAALAQLRSIEELGRVSPGAASVAAEAEDRGVARHVGMAHAERVDALAFAPSGRHLASVGGGAAVVLWDVETGRSQAFAGHEDRVSTVDFSPDGRRFATGSHDGTVRIWTTAQRGVERVLRGHAGAVRRVRFGPNGRWLVSIGEDRTVRRWRVADGAVQVGAVKAVERRAFVFFSPEGRSVVTGGHGTHVRRWNVSDWTSEVVVAHRAGVTALAQSRDGRHLASADEQGTVVFTDLETGDVARYRGHEGPVLDLAFSGDGLRVASAGFDRTVRVLRLDGRAPRVFTGHLERVAVVAFAPDDRHVVSGSWDRVIRVWNLDTSESQRLLGHRDVISSLVFSADGTYLASASWDRSVRIWTFAPAAVRVLRGHTVGVHGVDFSPDGSFLASGGHDDQVRVWSMDGTPPLVFDGHRDHVFRVYFSPDGRFVASTSDDRTVRLWPSDGTGPRRVLKGHEADVEEMAFSPDGRWLATAGEDNAVWLWSLDTRAGRRLSGHEDHVTDVRFAPDSSRVASSSRDGTVRVWQVKDGGVRRLGDGRGPVWSVDFAPNGAEIASAGEEGVVRLWDLQTFREVHRFDVADARVVRYAPGGNLLAVTTAGPEARVCGRAYGICERLVGHRAVIWDLVFALDGRALVTASGDNTVRIWDVLTAESRVLFGHDAPVFDVDVSPDDRWIASASADTTVRVWPLRLPPEPDALVHWIGQQTTWVPAEVELR